MVTEADIRLADGRNLHVYDAREDGNDKSPGSSGSPSAVLWLHGSPNVGSPPEPLFAAAAANGLRWISYDRPGYGGSSALAGRTVASAAADVAAIADALGITRLVALGHSGGGPHALACAALLPDRVVAAVSMSAPAPFDADGPRQRAAVGLRSGCHHRPGSRPESCGQVGSCGQSGALPGSVSAQRYGGGSRDGTASSEPPHHAPGSVSGRRGGRGRCIDIRNSSGECAAGRQGTGLAAVSPPQGGH